MRCSRLPGSTAPCSRHTHRAAGSRRHPAHPQSRKVGFANPACRPCTKNIGLRDALAPRVCASQLPVVSVVRDAEAQLLPGVGAVVTCKVCSINSRFAKVNILYVGSTPLKSTFRGTIRKEDIRATEKDKVEVYKSFRPGDIVLAKVISLGDAQSNYLLSTAENELGVVVARSEAGVQMVPISWCEMQCPQTHTKDFRKVARVQPQFLQT
ncbi:exosome complex component CSL4 [Meleagris gallopavo]|uniref:exosome complex component CSL4 n=1 Tax=Meleagris gallopavo TaxID=9103 RepID=UPI000549B36E|nr:exosome complex component CSL4 [Meleagris gallopavo]